MVDYREIMRLKSLGYTQRQIAASVHSGRDTVSEVLSLAQEKGLAWPLDDTATNPVLLNILYPARQEAASLRKQPDYAYIHKELARPGVTLTLLWNEYCDQCRAEGTAPYMYTQFCDKYRHWTKLTKATMRIQHKPGEAMQVDWAGNTIPVHDPVTGEETKAYLFVAVLPCSCYAYVEACPSMQTECWIQCHVHAYQYFGGVTRLLIPDNLKTGVTSNTRYETVLNRSYSEMAEYYGTAVVPARVKHPQDKSLAEGTVRYASTQITAALRNQKFFSVHEVQEAIAEKLEELNARPFQKRPGSRQSAYLEEEKPFMRSLPSTPYEAAIWMTAHVGSDYLVSDGRNKYSVPFDLIGEQVDVRCTGNTVEVFYNGSRVSSHRRVAVSQREPIVKPEHMPAEHRAYLNYNAETFTAWATTVGEATEKVISHFLFSGRVPEQGYKFCASLTKLAKQYGKKRLEDACQQVLSITETPSIRTISSVLKNSPHKSAIHSPAVSTESYGVTRGAAYFKKGGEQK